MLNESIQCDDGCNVVLSNDTSYIEDSANSLNSSFSTNESEGNPADNENEFKRDIQEWAIKFNIPHNAVNALLLILNKYTSCCFPNDSRSLLHTPRSTNIMPINVGHYYHFGLKRAVEALLKNRTMITNDETVSLLINIDG